MEQDNNINLTRQPRVTLRISRYTMAFAVPNAQAEAQVVYEPYVVKSGISTAANLREAFKTAHLLTQPFTRAQVMVDSQVLMVPIEEFDEQQMEALYLHSFADGEGEAVMQSVLPNLNAVAVFGVNKDLRLVIEDHYADVRFIPMVQPVWSYMHQRSFTGTHRKLYGYFHDKKLDIFCFDKNRFKFTNCFAADQSRDAAYYLLYVWQQLQMDAEKDELYLSGDIPDREWLLEALHRYMRKAFAINPSADFNRAPITQVKGMPLDLMTLFLKGR